MAKRTEDEVRFSEAEKAQLVHRLQRYFENELRLDIGRFDAEFLIDFVAKEMGAYFYNRGVQDAQAVLMAKVDDIQDAFFQLEKPTEFRR